MARPRRGHTVRDGRGRLAGAECVAVEGLSFGQNCGIFAVEIDIPFDQS